MPNSKELIAKYMEVFNAKNAEALGEFYNKNAVIQRTNGEPMFGWDELFGYIKKDLQSAKARKADNIFEDGEWVILEWSETGGKRGCKIFKIVGEKILVQKNYQSI
ncbi:MAG: nuclear transport factor 2 family protein [Campylobacter sp.]|nr:nuclear transport factor 2 family protein [Campylobacter sp.]MBO7475988.1 nuclear transport factor 2 family protein [Campylobacter sp.]MBQ7270872.1 nuclear transport factor 2 family protein [Campylobacter sp.]MBR4141575.1 nuclear transport factor 2 family protein [Campylobacter sp.]MBR6953147.1 nuclear transport factor 2 family protein [Campylobacter sp.]